jgi:DNA-binding Lrp family transcriptional regulator
VSQVVDEVTDRRAARELALAGLSYAFLLDQLAGGMADLEPLDALLVLAINQANIAPLTRDPGARARYGQLEAPAPDAERRPVSVNAIAGSLGLPFETVRRRIRRLADVGVCVISAEGVLVPASFLVSEPYLRSVMASHVRLRRFYEELSAAGLIEPLPPSAYSLEDSVPVRAAARLLADYLLRAIEGLMREATNAVALMSLVALLNAALTARQTGRSRPLPIRTLAEMLKLPHETVRRHVAVLAEDGYCERTSVGVVMPPQVLERPSLKLLLADNGKDVQRLFAGLSERGVILAWDADQAAARARA